MKPRIHLSVVIVTAVMALSTSTTWGSPQDPAMWLEKASLAILQGKPREVEEELMHTAWRIESSKSDLARIAECWDATSGAVNLLLTRVEGGSNLIFPASLEFQRKAWSLRDKGAFRSEEWWAKELGWGCARGRILVPTGKVETLRDAKGKVIQTMTMVKSKPDPRIQAGMKFFQAHPPKGSFAIVTYAMARHQEGLIKTQALMDIYPSAKHEVWAARLLNAILISKDCPQGIKALALKEAQAMSKKHPRCVIWKAVLNGKLREGPSIKKSYPAK